MPKGPEGQKRPTDVVSNAVHVMRIATSEIDDVTVTTSDGKNAAAVSLGRKGGQARAKSLGTAKRKAIARKAAKARWSR